MPMGAGDAAGKFSAGPATGDECRLERGRVWVFDDGLLAGGGVEGGDRGQGPDSQVHSGAHSRLGER